MCIQQVASSTIRVLSAPDTPHFTFDAVVDMSVQQDGVFAGKLPYLFAPASHKSCVASAVCGLQLNTACAHGKQFTHVIWRHRAFYIATNLACLHYYIMLLQHHCRCVHLCATRLQAMIMLCVRMSFPQACRKMQLLESPLWTIA